MSGNGARRRDPVRVVFYTEGAQLGGAEIVTGYLIEALDPMIEVVVMGPSPAIVEWLTARRTAAGSECRAIVVPPFRSRFDLSARRAHRRALRELSPAIFHTVLNWQHACRRPIRVAARVRGVIPIAVEHLLPLSTSWRDRRRKRALERLIVVHVAVGHRAARIIERSFGIAPNSIRTIHNGVPDVAVEPTELGITGPVIGTAARLDPMKGLDVLLESLVRLEGVPAVIVGEGPLRDELEAQAERLRISDRVRFVGFSDYARSYLAAFDVMALPSRSLETLPLVIIEAMLAGRPVVASDIGSVAELVDDGVTGILVRPEDVDGLTEALARLLGDESLRRTMGANGRARALAQFSAPTMAHRYEALYDELSARCR